MKRWNAILVILAFIAMDAATSAPLAIGGPTNGVPVVPSMGKSQAGVLDTTKLTASDWASWPEVSIPTVADVEASCFEVERQCRRSGTAAALCAKEKRSCLAPARL